MTFNLEEIEYHPVSCEEVFNDLGQPVIQWTVQIWNKEITFQGYPTMKQLCLASDTRPHHWMDGFIFNDLKMWQKWDLFEFIINDLEIVKVTHIGADERNKAVHLASDLAEMYFLN